MNILNWLLYAGYEKKVYKEIQENLTQVNRTRLIVFAALFSSGCAVMTLCSFVVAGIAGMRNVYFLFLVMGLAVLALIYLAKKKIDSIITYLMYLFLIMVLEFGIIIGTVLSPQEISATFIALLLISSQLFIDRPYRVHLISLLMVISFVYMVITFKDSSTWNSDVINALIFCVVGMVLSVFNINTRVSRFLMEKRIRELAEIDQLTGLLNRNSYERALSMTSMTQKEGLYCVYLDVNGLHELNNTKGHEAGDRMLIYIARAMQSLFGKESTYRIGGDEYVAIGNTLSETEIQNRISRLREQVDREGYHVAIGYSLEDLSDSHIQRIVKSAETKMYADKKAYYEKTGKNPQRIH